MLKKKIDIYLVFAFFIILLTLISAFIIDYQMNQKPCALCIYQRIPYIFSIFLMANIFFSKKYKKITLLILSMLFLFSTSLAFYHFGIEQGFFKELSVCENKNISEIISKEDLLNQLKEKAISCKDVSFRILGLSLATINMMLSFILSIMFIRLFIFLR
jgi:disulfide bond formation protein DsbB